MTERSDKEAAEAARQRESGEPGGGAGRRDEVGGSGVYPASAGKAPPGAQIRTPRSWGQGDRGPEGYEDSGPSELDFTEEEIRAIKKQARGGGSGAAPDEPREDPATEGQ